MKEKLMSSALLVAALAPSSIALPFQKQDPSKPSEERQTSGRKSKDELRRLVEKRVKKIIVDVLGVDEVKVIPDASCMNDLGAHSLNAAEVVARLESEFKFEIPDKDVAKLQRVRDIYDYVEGRVRPSNKKVR